MKAKFLSIVLFTVNLALYSCTENETNVESDNHVVDNLEIVDSSDIESVENEMVISVELENILLKSDTTYSTPFSLDSNFVTELDDTDEEKKRLSNQDVQFLSQNLVKNEPTDWSKYAITSFIEVDSMRLMNTYEAYVESIDIGMIQEADAYFNSKVVINDNAYLLLWSISYSTYEACPYASGTVIYGTFIYDNEAINTVTLGESSGGGDAPYWGTTFITSQINSTSIVSEKISESGGDEDPETGEEIVEKSLKSFSLKITKSGLQVIGGEEE